MSSRSQKKGSVAVPNEGTALSAKNITQRRRNEFTRIYERVFRPQDMMKRFSRFSRRLATKNIPTENQPTLLYQLAQLDDVQEKQREVLSPRREKKNQKEEQARLKTLYQNSARATLKIRYAPYIKNIKNLEKIYNPRNPKKDLYPTEERVQRLGLAAWNATPAEKRNTSEFVNFETFFNQPINPLPAVKESNNNNNNNNNGNGNNNSEEEDFPNTTLENLSPLTAEEKESMNQLIRTKLPRFNNQNIFAFPNSNVKSKEAGSIFWGAAQEDPNLQTAIDKLWGRHWKDKKSKYFSKTQKGTKRLLFSKEFHKHCTGTRIKPNAKGFFKHEHQARTRTSAKCCSLFENGQVAHTLSKKPQGAEKSVRGGPKCGYLFSGKPADGTFANADTPIA